jgi:DHA2 family multidrug resistance protein-like MFS transporter
MPKQTHRERRWWALAAVNLAVLACGLDGTVTSVALPTLARSLHASEADLQWFSSAYLLALAAAMLPSGLFGDRYGRKKVMLGALTLFGAGSAACPSASSPAEFIAARLLLGVAGAGVVVMALSAVTTLFRGEERQKAIGVWAAVNFVALPIGPILGGWLLSRCWWGWVFLLNVPVALIGIVAVSLLVPESRPRERPEVDWVGITTATASLVALTYGLVEAGEAGWSSATALSAIAAGLALVLCFVGWQRRLGRLGSTRRLIDPALLHAGSYTVGVVLQALAILAMFGVFFVLPQYFQGVFGTDAMGAGVRLLPLIGGLTIGALPAEKLARSHGWRLPASAGFVVLAAGLLLGAGTASSSGDAFAGTWTAVAGAGMGLALATAASAALAEVSEEQASIGSALMQALNKIGAPLGTAVLGSVLNRGYATRLDLSQLPPPAAAAARRSLFSGVEAAERMRSLPLLVSVRSSFVHGMNEALLVSAAVALLGAVLAAVLLPRQRRVGARSGDFAGATDASRP